QQFTVYVKLGTAQLFNTEYIMPILRDIDFPIPLGREWQTQRRIVEVVRNHRINANDSRLSVERCCAWATIKACEAVRLDLGWVEQVVRRHSLLHVPPRRYPEQLGHPGRAFYGVGSHNAVQSQPQGERLPR